MSEERRIRWQDHIGLIVTASTFAIIVTRLLGVSGWDPITASAVVAAGGATNVALGVAVASAPSLLTLALVWTAPRLAYDMERRGKEWWGRYWMAFFMGVVVAIALVPLFFMGMGVAVALYFVWAIRKRRSAPPRTEPESEKAGPDYPVTYAALAVLMLVALSVTPYLPPEVFRANAGADYRGYIVGREDEALVILTYDQSVIRVPVSTEHEFCNAPTSALLSATLPTLGRRSDYPECPKN